MSNILSQIKNCFNNSKLHHKYIYSDSSTKFIYESLENDKIVGLNKFLINRVVEVKKEVILRGKTFGLITLEGIKIGWLHLENLVRIYRLPKINGKITNKLETKFNDVDYGTEIESLRNKIIKAYYYFLYNNRKYLLVGMITDNEIYPVPFDSFVQLQMPNEKINVRVDKNTALYHSSNYQTKIGEIQKNDQYEVISYFNGSNEVKIKNGQDKYWIMLDHNMPEHNEYLLDETSMDILDFITYLYYDNISKTNEIKSMNGILDVMRKNIIINHEDETIYWKRYLGETNGDK